MMEVKTDEKIFKIAMRNKSGKRFFATTNSLSGALIECWADYFRPNPADNNIVRKVSFVKKCTLTNGSNIIIGSGIYGGGGDEDELTRLTIN
ncbi:MAG: hypothetical protein GY797_30990 [Deltaproteobacteria bacterium]|nr:hypothetical protein [Deltaproteobacteria bacterium]